MCRIRSGAGALVNDCLGLSIAEKIAILSASSTMLEQRSSVLREGYKVRVVRVDVESKIVYLWEFIGILVVRDVESLA